MSSEHLPCVVSEIRAFIYNFLKEERFANLRGQLAATCRGIDRLRIGSICSGWGVLEMVMETFRPAWNQECVLEDNLLLEVRFVIQTHVCGRHKASKNQNQTIRHIPIVNGVETAKTSSNTQ